SPQHRLLVNSSITLRMFGQQEVLVAAIHHTRLPGIYVDETMPSVEYHHLVLDRHDIILAEGVPTESLYPGPVALASITQEARAELFAILPELNAPDRHPDPARPIPPGKLQKKLVERHLRNRKPTLGQSIPPAL
ncbi:hypothetical protein HA397_28000, partial [Escherichia coli]|nr:hypothetical protein [Escherichia coli]